MQAIDNLELKQTRKPGLIVDEGVATDPLGVEPLVEPGGAECLVGLECLLNIARALGMGSCLSADVARDKAAYAPPLLEADAASPGGGGNKRRKKLMSSDSDKKEMALHRVPGRLFLNGSTEVGSLFSKQGKKGINQDAMIFWEKFGSKADTIFCGVFDGHGPHGHMVAKKVRDTLPLKLNAQWELNSVNKDGFSDSSSSAWGSLTSVHKEPNTYFDHEHNASHSDVFPVLKESFYKAFKVVDKELKLHPSIDCFCSGTTAVTLVKKGQDLVIGNLGDSRAVLGTRDKDDSLIAVQLTVDLKPNLPREAERIRLCKGRVFALQNEPAIARVWLPHSDTPGLAMARAFGDFCLKNFGLISVPDVSYRRLTEKDEFVVLATDGIWDVLSNQEVVDIVASASRANAAQTLVESAVRSWRMKYPTSKVDDCAVVCLFLGSTSDNSSASRACQEPPPMSLEQPDIGH